MRRFLISLSALLVTACVTTPEYFSDYSELNNIGMDYELDIGTTHLAKLREPSGQQLAATPFYRVLVLSGVTPVHIIRIMPEDDGSAQVVTKRLDAGYRIQGDRYLDKKDIKKISNAKFLTFKSAFDDTDFFQQNAMPGLEDYHLCMHATFFIYEFPTATDPNVAFENVCAFTTGGVKVLSSFYDAAGIKSGADWSLVDYFEDENE